MRRPTKKNPSSGPNSRRVVQSARARDLVGDLGGSGGGATAVQEQQDENARHTDGDGLGAGRVGAVVLADVQAHVGDHVVALLSTELVVHQASQGNGVTEELLASDGVEEDDHGGSDKEDILEDTGHGQDNGGGLADQQNDGSIEKESNERVGNESTDSETVDVTHGDAGKIGEEGDKAVGDSAGGGVVVEGDQGVHLELGGAEQTLDHNETESLEDDTGDLDDETKSIKLDLTEGGDHDTEHDDHDVSKGLHVGGSDSESPGGQKSDNSVGSLENILC